MAYVCDQSFPFQCLISARFSVCELFNIYCLHNNIFRTDPFIEMRGRNFKKKQRPNLYFQPHPLYRSLSARAVADCSTTCGVEPTLNQTEKCASKKWVPEYKKSGECECLKRYRCCSNTCAKADNETCWNNGNKGKFYLGLYCR